MKKVSYQLEIALRINSYNQHQRIDMINQTLKQITDVLPLDDLEKLKPLINDKNLIKN